MLLRQFGSTALKVFPLALGTVNLSWLTDEADSFRMLDAAFSAGINIIDTADSYNGGRAEELLGRWLSRGGGRREKTVLATKVYSPPAEWGSPDPARRSGAWVGPNQRGLSAKHIREACEASLRRLGTDYIDVYQMHHIDRSARWEEIWQAMEVLVQQGKVIYVGSSNFAGWHIAQAQAEAKRRNFLGLVSEQSLYNLLRRTVELEVIPASVAHGMAFLPYSPLGAGMLAGESSDEGAGRRASLRRPRAVEEYQSYCASIGLSCATVALAWLVSRPGVTAPVIGPRTLQQLEASLAAIEVELPGDAAAKLDALFPGPGGAAPEAYAW